MPDNPEQKAEQNELYAGKYKTKEEFEKGYWHSQQEGLAQREARIRAEAELNVLKAQMAQAPKSNVHEDNLRQHDIPVDDLNAIIEERATARANEALKEALGPLTAAMEAQSQMTEAYEDFDLNKIQRVVGSDPMVSEQYNKLLATDPRAAYQMGYMAMKAQPAPEQKPEKPVKEQPNRRQQQDAAAVRSAGSGPGNLYEQSNPGLPDPEQYDALLERGYMGDWMPFLRARLGSMMDEHIDPTLHLDE